MKTILDYCIVKKGPLSKFKQDSFQWKNKYNKKPFIDIMDFNRIINDIPENIGREDIIKAFKDDKFYEGFIMSMMWGGISTQPSKGNKGNITTSYAYKAFSYSKNTINSNLSDIKKFIERGEIESAYKKLENEYRIPGVGTSYFTKILSFISESLEDSRNLLIYDKWTKLIHIHLLFDSDDKEKAYELFQKKHLESFCKKTNNKYVTNLISAKNNKSWDAYSDYCNRITSLSNRLTERLKVDINPFHLESFLFGRSLKIINNRKDSNPRYWIQKNYVTNYLPLILIKENEFCSNNILGKNNVDENLINAFNHLTIGKEYKANCLNNILAKNNLSGNLAGISYNRWNRGMTVRDYETLMFEWVRRGVYKYLGVNYKYNGQTFLYIGNETESLVGTWTNGEFEFSANDVHSFGQWITKGHPTVDFLISDLGTIQ